MVYETLSENLKCLPINQIPRLNLALSYFEQLPPRLKKHALRFMESTLLLPQEEKQPHDGIFFKATIDALFSTERNLKWSCFRFSLC